jgi:hypothetical protein
MLKRGKTGLQDAKRKTLKGRSIFIVGARGMNRAEDFVLSEVERRLIGG